MDGICSGAGTHHIDGALGLVGRRGHRTRACGRVSSPARRGRVPQGEGCVVAPYGGPVPGSPGPCSPRSADGPVIIISRPVLPDHFLTPWTAVSLASLRRHTSGHFSSLLCFVHSINLCRDPAQGSIHLCLTSGTSARWRIACSFFFFLFLFFPLDLCEPRK